MLGSWNRVHSMKILSSKSFFEIWLQAYLKWFHFSFKMSHVSAKVKAKKLKRIMSCKVHEGYQVFTESHHLVCLNRVRMLVELNNDEGKWKMKTALNWTRESILESVQSIIFSCTRYILIKLASIMRTDWLTFSFRSLRFFMYKLIIAKESIHQ